MNPPDSERGRVLPHPAPNSRRFGQLLDEASLPRQALYAHLGLVADASDRLAARERRRLATARLAHLAMPLTDYYRCPGGLTGFYCKLTERAS